MKKVLFLISLIGVVLSCKNDASKKQEEIERTKPQDDLVIVPGERVGMITASTTEAQLEQIYGAENLQMQRIPVAEGDEQEGVILFPGTAKEIEIIWQTATSAGTPAFVRISKDSTVWKTEDGITIGSSLEALETANNKPFTFNGFEWDYGGLVTDWNGGNFDAHFVVALVPQDFSTMSPEMLGDVKLHSDDPKVKSLQAKVGSIVITFE